MYVYDINHCIRLVIAARSFAKNQRFLIKAKQNPEGTWLSWTWLDIQISHKYYT